MVDKAKEIKKKAETVKEKIEQATSIIDTANEVATADYSKFTEADYVRLAAQIAGLADPTGIAGVVENFSYPKCSQILKS